MTRMSKQARRRAVSPRRPKVKGPKTGSKLDALEFGYKMHANAVISEGISNRFIPKVR